LLPKIYAFPLSSTTKSHTRNVSKNTTRKNFIRTVRYICRRAGAQVRPIVRPKNTPHGSNVNLTTKINAIVSTNNARSFVGRSIYLILYISVLTFTTHGEVKTPHFSGRITSGIALLLYSTLSNPH